MTHAGIAREADAPEPRSESLAPAFVTQQATQTLLRFARGALRLSGFRAPERALATRPYAGLASRPYAGSFFFNLGAVSPDALFPPRPRRARRLRLEFS